MMGFSNNKTLTLNTTDYLIPVLGRVHHILFHISVVNRPLRQKEILGTEWTKEQIAMVEVLGFVRRHVTYKKLSVKEKKMRTAEHALGVKKLRPSKVYYTLTRTGEKALEVLNNFDRDGYRWRLPKIASDRPKHVAWKDIPNILRPHLLRYGIETFDHIRSIYIKVKINRKRYEYHKNVSW